MLPTLAPKDNRPQALFGDETYQAISAEPLSLVRFFGEYETDIGLVYHCQGNGDLSSSHHMRIFGHFRIIGHDLTDEVVVHAIRDPHLDDLADLGLTVVNQNDAVDFGCLL